MLAHWLPGVLRHIKAGMSSADRLPLPADPQLYAHGLLPLNAELPISHGGAADGAAGLAAAYIDPAAASDGQLATSCQAATPGTPSYATITWLLMRRHFGNTPRATATSGHMRKTAFVESEQDAQPPYNGYST